MRTFKLTILLLAFASLCATAQPTVKTDTRYARGATKAFGRMSLVMNGYSLKERGFCWSESKEPTVDDNKSSRTFSNNGLIYIMEGLKPATKYYARAYVTVSTGETYYGDAIKFVTVPQGTITWDYDNGGSSAENTRINNAVKECVQYWNECSSIYGLNLSVHYGAQTPTADCSYGGWMRVGPNASYQRTGTVMHEALHAIGIGQHDLWYGSSSPLRKGAGTGDWLGDRANDFLKFWDNDNNTCFHGDATHIWPYGINGAQEDKGTEFLYTANGLMAQAVCEDGLPCTWQRAFGLPHYSFSQEDDIKYYIKNEDESMGLLTSFLVETADHKLQWQAMTSEEAKANAAAAWYVTFTPSDQLYQLRNASTGNYMTYKTTGTDGIVCEAASTVSDANSFCLMRSRTDVTSSTGTKLSTERGYWMLRPDFTNAKPMCLTAEKNGAVSATAYSNVNSSKKQRWLLLTAEQVKAMENSEYIAACDAFDKENQIAGTLIGTPHASISADADAPYMAALQSIQAKYGAAETASEVWQLSDDLRTAMANFLTSVYVTDMDSPFDITAFFINPKFENGTTGWTVATGGAHDYNEVEFYVDKAKTVNLVQLIKAMPYGSYGVKAQAFQRPGSNDQTYADYIAGTDNVKVYLEMTMELASFAKQNVKNIMAERQTSQVHKDDKALSDGTYVPNTMASTRAHFDKGYYDNLLKGYTANDGALRIYFKGQNSAASSWSICSNFRLYYYGGLTLEEIEERTTAITAVETAPAPQYSKAYNIQGQQVSENAKGIVIINGKKYLK